MSALGTVVVGFDGSPSSVDALALGARLAQADGAELVAAFVYRADPVAFGDEGEFQQWQREIAMRELGAARTLQPSVELSAVRARSVVRGLHELAEERSAGLVVVGSTHRGPIGRIVPGSTGQRLLEGAPCPVAVAPRGWGSSGGDALLSPVVAGYDGEPDSAAAVRWAARVAGVLGAPLRLVSVIEPVPVIPNDPITFVRPDAVEDALREAQESLRTTLTQELSELAGTLRGEASPEIETVVIDGHPADQLVARVPDAGGLLVVGSRGYGPIGAVFMGSTAAEVLREATSPVIVVPRSS